MIALVAQAALFVIGCISFLYGYDLAELDTKNYDYCLIGVGLIFAADIIYALRDMRQRTLLLMLLLGIGLFILSRPLIGYTDPAINWMFDLPSTTKFTMEILFVTLVALFLGAATYDLISHHNRNVERHNKKRSITVVEDEAIEYKYTKKDLERLNRWDWIRYAAFICFTVCLLGAYMEGALKLAHMSGLSYEEYYLTSASEYVPWPVSVLSTMCPFMFCSYLATMPRRGPATVGMVLFVMTSIPMLIIGSRGDFVLYVLFCAFYYVLRSLLDKKNPWIGRREIIAACIIIPVGIFAMGVLNYTRSGHMVDPQGFLATILDAFYKQGVTYAVLGYSYQVLDNIQSLGFKFFTIGPFINNITQGSIGQMFFGFEYLGDSNSTALAIKGNLYAHTMSFFAHPNYLKGEGYGSSYMLELFADFGFGGVLIGSFAIAFIFSSMTRQIGRTWFGGTISLNAALNVFHMPRGSFVEFISFIWTTRFIFAIVLVIMAAAILKFVASHTDPQSVWFDIIKRSDKPALAPQRTAPRSTAVAQINTVDVSRRIRIVGTRSEASNV